MYNVQELSTEAISWTRRMIWERMILHLEKNTQRTREHVPGTLPRTKTFKCLLEVNET